MNCVSFSWRYSFCVSVCSVYIGFIGALTFSYLLWNWIWNLLSRRQLSGNFLELIRFGCLFFIDTLCDHWGSDKRSVFLTMESGSTDNFICQLYSYIGWTADLVLLVWVTNMLFVVFVDIITTLQTQGSFSM